MSRKSNSDQTNMTPRFITSDGTINALSSSANPDDDWTKISDLVERRKIQNRIAQRNYRKRLKKRLEERERGQEPGSASPPQLPVALQHQQDQKAKVQRNRKSPKVIHRQSPRKILQKPSIEDLMLGSPLEREGSRTSTLPPASPTYNPYPQQPYHSVFPAEYQYGGCIDPTPSMMHSHEAGKQEDDLISPFSMSYQGFPAI